MRDLNDEVETQFLVILSWNHLRKGFCLLDGEKGFLVTCTLSLALVRVNNLLVLRADGEEHHSTLGLTVLTAALVG